MKETAQIKKKPTDKMLGSPNSDDELKNAFSNDERQGNINQLVRDGLCKGRLVQTEENKGAEGGTVKEHERDAPVIAQSVWNSKEMSRSLMSLLLSMGFHVMLLSLYGYAPTNTNSITIR